MAHIIESEAVVKVYVFNLPLYSDPFPPAFCDPKPPNVWIPLYSSRTQRGVDPGHPMRIQVRPLLPLQLNLLTPPRTAPAVQQ